MPLCDDKVPLMSALPEVMRVLEAHSNDLSCALDGLELLLHLSYWDDNRVGDMGGGQCRGGSTMHPLRRCPYTPGGLTSAVRGCHGCASAVDCAC